MDDLVSILKKLVEELRKGLYIPLLNSLRDQTQRSLLLAKLGKMHWTLSKEMAQ